MYFVERVYRGESLFNWLIWLTHPPAVCWSVIMGDTSPGQKGVFWTHPEAFRTGPPRCPVQGMAYIVTQPPWPNIVHDIFLIQAHNQSFKWPRTHVIWISNGHMMIYTKILTHSMRIYLLFSESFQYYMTRKIGYCLFGREGALKIIDRFAVSTYQHIV